MGLRVTTYHKTGNNTGVSVSTKLSDYIFGSVMVFMLELIFVYPIKYVIVLPIKFVVTKVKDIIIKHKKNEE